MREPASYYLRGGKLPQTSIGRLSKFPLLALLICANSAAIAQNLPAAIEGEWMHKETGEALRIEKGGVWLHPTRGRAKVREANDNADVKVYYDNGSTCAYRITILDKGNELDLSPADNTQNPDYCPSGALTRVSAPKPAPDAAQPIILAPQQTPIAAPQIVAAPEQTPMQQAPYPGERSGDGWQNQPPQPSTTPPAAENDIPPMDNSFAAWRGAIAKTPPPSAGCFTSTSPSLEWKEVPCVAMPPYPHTPPTRRPLIGDKNGDYNIVYPRDIAGVTVYNLDVVGVKEETGNVSGNPPAVRDAFSLQINSNRFQTAACNPPAGQTRTPDNCQGWQQFVYDNTKEAYGDKQGKVFIQYWLIDYLTGGILTCPTGWNTNKTNCWRNNPNGATSAPSQSASDLKKLLLSAGNGSVQDSFTLFVDGVAYSVVDASVLGLAGHWTETEYNVFGQCCSSQANFNRGSTLRFSISAMAGTDKPATCGINSTTGETNNMTMLSCTTSGLAAYVTEYTPPVPKGAYPAIAYYYLMKD